MKTSDLKKRLQKDRPTTTISLRMPEDVVDDLKRIASLLGFPSYQALVRTYTGQGLRRDLEMLDEEPPQGEDRELGGPDPREPAPEDCGTAGCADLDAMKVVQRAKRGDPGALGSILTCLASLLRGEASLPTQYAAYCSQGLLELAETLKAAEPGFRECVIEAKGEVGDAPEAWTDFHREVIQGRGPRLPEQGRSQGWGYWSQKPSRDKLGRAFCRAFHISRRPGAARMAGGWMPYRAFPYRDTRDGLRTREDYLDKMSALLHHGESQTHAIEILRSAVQEPKSDTTIRRWMKAEGFYEKLDRGEQERKKLNFGFLVLDLVEQGVEVELACSMLARSVVQRSCGLPDATVFLQPQTVKAAYEMALKRSSRKSPRLES